VSGFDTGQVTNTIAMFQGCRGLTELDVSGFDTSQVTNMGYMFYNCSGLAELDVSGFDTGKVTAMGAMFYNCSGLTELDVSEFDTSQVTRMEFMFNGCRGLTELDVSKFDTGQVTDTSAMFYNCSGLTELDVSGFDTSKVLAMTSMFENCSSLTELDVSNFDTSKVLEMVSMFKNCSGLTELDMSKFDTSKVLTMRAMFSNCSGLSEISVSKMFKFEISADFPFLTAKHVWQEENNKKLFFSSDDMIAYHNSSNETNTYRKVAYVELTMNAKGGKFEDGTESRTQIRVMDELWEEQVPKKENYQFDGWYLDESYAEEFDFSQPATESLTIFAKWIENYTVTIPATMNLNSENKMTISGVNNSSGTLKVNLKETESQISDFTRLRMTHKQNADTTVHAKLSWEQQASDIWNILTINPEASSASKSADIQMTKPEDIQAGKYEGQMVFSIRYE
ncbi:BspA family leucine-rich repeat surface protein, partial [Enterococcus hulanensis]|uniref:BspA family leucine-rich repeat surface protein n=1 Tax=Enterococcus hulanensis TaxID=2559929 RepID=UPI001A8D1FA8